MAMTFNFYPKKELLHEIFFVNVKFSDMNTILAFIPDTISVAQWYSSKSIPILYW